jgi:hypothetical protein
MADGWVVADDASDRGQLAPDRWSGVAGLWESA